MAGRVCIAEIGAPHGIRGEVRLRSFTETPGDVARFGELESEDGARRFSIEALRKQGDGFVARLAGVADRDAAAALTRTKLFVAREKLPAVADDDTFYVADLIGLAAQSTDGAPLGKVRAVHNFGAGDVLEIAPDGGAALLVPFSKAAVPEIAMQEGRLIVVLPTEVEGRGDGSGDNDAMAR